MIHGRRVHQKRGMHPAIILHTLRTTGNVHGFASSPRYAPTLRSTFWGKVSLSQRSFKANIASGGSRVTPCHSSGKRSADPSFPEDTLHLPRGGAIAVDVDGRWSTICCRRAVAVAIVGVGGVGRSEGGDLPTERATEEFICAINVGHCENHDDARGFQRRTCGAFYGSQRRGQLRRTTQRYSANRGRSFPSPFP